MHIGIEYGFINIIPSFIMSMCGIMIGALMFFQINYLIRKKRKEMHYGIPKNKIKLNVDFIEHSIYTNPKLRKYFYNKFEKEYRFVKEKTDTLTEEDIEINSLSDEEKLDKILDKINAVGKGNLTKDELNFLNDYSNKLQLLKDDK